VVVESAAGCAAGKRLLISGFITAHLRCGAVKKTRILAG
jgi:hypothetical protein